MLASRQRSLSSSSSPSESEDVFCCGGDKSSSSLERRALLVVAGMVEEAVVMPIGPRAMNSMASYLQGLDSKLLTSVVTAVLASRPRWLPLEYHWAPLDHDPLLHLLWLLGGRLTSLAYTCHPLSREPLLQALSAMPKLTVLSLPEAADDSALAVVGAACHILATLSVRRSRGVTDEGVRRLLLRRHTYTRSRWRRLFARWRALRSSVTRQQSRYRPLPPSLSDQALPLDSEHLNPLSATLTHLDLSGTRVSKQGAEWARSLLPSEAFVDATQVQRRSLRSQTSLEDQMARLLAPITP